ncbi:Uncharacterized protein FKW44_009318 [Caligus rogercresseyi]|uniref:Uncharacterized protein n=1 Tax=Caligus rogercresseyi TaxID=217165 RepID=A0A7T8K8S8_CALRO|nr:Uncharacterized protein FKW44_009318 [Caligus rogercresseyi]
MKMSELAKKKSVDPSTVSKAVKAAGGRSLRKVERPLLTQRHRDLRLDRCRRILSDLKHNGDRVVFFSDEKTFTVDPVYNKQNDRVICFGNVSNVIRSVSKTKHPASVMMGQDAADLVPDRVQAHGRRLLGAFEDQGTPIGLQDNQEVGEVIIRAVQDWMETNMKFWPKTMWPPQSPDLNPLDFSFWWHVESQACRVRHSNVEDLKTSVEKKWKAMKRSYIITVCQAFRRRVEAVIEAKGGEIHK